MSISCKAIFYLLIFISFSCSSKKELYQINCIGIENESYIKLKITNLINPSEYQIESASKDAIKTVLFSGYTSAQCQTQKPILKQTSEIENFKKIESIFFSKNGVWKTFVRNTLKEKNTTAFEIMINKDQLRKYLEEQKIIKSLNIGF